MTGWFIGWVISIITANWTQDIMCKKWVDKLLHDTMTKMDWLKYAVAAITTITTSLGVYKVGLIITDEIVKETKETEK